MNAPRADIAEYSSFICNPQKDGVWSMRVELTEKQVSGLTAFLNLDQHMVYSRRRFHPSYMRRPSYRYGGDERPPILLPRLFAYLRASIPQKERANLPDLSPQDGPTSSGRQHRRAYSYLTDLLTPPATLGAAKRKRLATALQIYKAHFQNYFGAGQSCEDRHLEPESDHIRTGYRGTASCDQDVVTVRGHPPRSERNS